MRMLIMVSLFIFSTVSFAEDRFFSDAELANMPDFKSTDLPFGSLMNIAGAYEIPKGSSCSKDFDLKSKPITKCNFCSNVIAKETIFFDSEYIVRGSERAPIGDSGVDANWIEIVSVHSTKKVSEGDSRKEYDSLQAKYLSEAISKNTPIRLELYLRCALPKNKADVISMSDFQKRLSQGANIFLSVKKIQTSKIEPAVPGSNDDGGAVTQKAKKANRVPANH